MPATPSVKSTTHESWPTTTARVISCQYQYAKFQDIDFSNETNPLSHHDGSSFLVTFSYIVNGELFVDDFESQTDYKEGHQFEIGYDPANPQSNTYSKPTDSTRSKIITWIFGVVVACLLIYLSRKYGWTE
jgi:hypothetical protein